MARKKKVKAPAIKKIREEKHEEIKYEEVHTDKGNAMYGIHERSSYNSFFSAMFKTFGYTLLFFMGFLLIIFLLMWIFK
jgi:hypothetical protein